ncbi:MAG TPA: acireductone synthase [Vicinamibacteria bacterium]|nr:acireductone synthase [Vicinamibacteria bacterium]
MIDASVTSVLLLDIEGTTTSVSFVYDVLLPYARARLASFLEGPDGEEDRRALREERAREADPSAPAWTDSREEEAATAYALWLMDRDRKSTALKALQGRIWEKGYLSGALVSHVYPDVPPALERWHGEGRRVAIFSSGSVPAQRLLFAHTPQGDLTRWIEAYFDTTTGPKREADSYRRIAAELQAPPRSILFVSDVTAELDAARVAGLRTALCVREGELPAGAHPVVRTFDEVRL